MTNLCPGYVNKTYSFYVLGAPEPAVLWVRLKKDSKNLLLTYLTLQARLTQQSEFSDKFSGREKHETLHLP